jgi:pyruvate/2-oxoglutarate dehydrogenase complex dihydrolipoamide dehydrogenase (E3) component
MTRVGRAIEKGETKGFMKVVADSFFAFLGFISYSQAHEKVIVCSPIWSHAI